MTKVTEKESEKLLESRIEKGIRAMNSIIIDSFSSLEARIPHAVNEAVTTTVNGKILKVQKQIEDAQEQNKDILKILADQNIVIARLEVLLQDRDFRSRLWRLLRKIGTWGVGIGSAWILFKEIFLK